MEKVRLHKELAETIEYYRDNFDHHEQAIMKVAMEDVRFNGDPDYCHVIKEYVKSIDNLKILMSALVNGYEVEITPEEKVREYVERLQLFVDSYSTCSSDRSNCSAKILGITTVLDILGIKISGVNAE